MCNQKDLYGKVIAVTNRRLSVRPFLSQISRICECGPRALVLREKDLSEEEYFSLAKQVSQICASADVKLIIHKYRSVAAELGIRSIHLPIAELEAMRAGDGAYAGLFDEIGCSVHSVEEACRAQELGADYLFAGHIYRTDCKKGLPPRGLEFLREICGTVRIPVYAIGGIRPEAGQIREVMDAGAAGVCIMSAMMQLF